MAGGRLTARRVPNTQVGTHQLGMRQPPRWEIGPSSRMTRSRYAECVRNRQNGTEWPRRCRTIRSAPNSEERANLAAELRTERRASDGQVRSDGQEPSHLQRSQGDPISRFGIPQETSSFWRRIWYCAYTLRVTDSHFHSIFVGRALFRLAARECILRCDALRSTTIAFCDDAS